MMDGEFTAFEVPIEEPQHCAVHTRKRKSISHEVVCGTLQLLDFCAILFAALVAFWIYLIGILGGDGTDLVRYSLIAAVAGIIFFTLMRWSQNYGFKRLDQLGWQLRQVTLLWAATISLLTIWAFLSKVTETYSRGWAVTFAIAVLAELALSRVILLMLFRGWRAQRRLVRSVAIVGAGEVGKHLIAKLKAEGGNEVDVVGVFDDRKTRLPASVAGCPIFGTTDRLIEFSQTTRIDEIVIALPLQDTQRIA
jgi:FlaA1/EpsC-like NDP-sugar epimerase